MFELFVLSFRYFGTVARAMIKMNWTVCWEQNRVVSDSGSGVERKKQTRKRVDRLSAQKHPLAITSVHSWSWHLQLRAEISETQNKY